LDQKGVTLLPGVKYEEINDKGLVITGKDGQKQTLEADVIIPMTPLRPEDNLAKAMAGKVPEIHVCGSCNTPGLIRDAVNEGCRVGFDI
jgi:2,4-dienoyl-CoA reductase (NADPH2)